MIIPIKNKKYLIKYTDNHSDYSYSGPAVFTGMTEIHDEELLYVFSNLENKQGFTDTALFSAEDIVKSLN